MISISKSYSFDSAHRLENPDWTQEENEAIFGKCFSKHGHTYKLTVEVAAVLDTETGMVLNYFDLDKIVKPIVETLDHEDLNKIFRNELGGRTTAENMVREIRDRIEVYLEDRHPTVTLQSVTLQETPKTTAKWTRG